MYFVNEKDASFGDAGKHSGKILGFFDRGSRSHLEFGSEFIRDDSGEGRLAEARRPAEKDVIKAFFALVRSPDENVEVALIEEVTCLQLRR